MIKIRLLARIYLKILFCNHYFSPLNTIMRKGKNPDPYLWQRDPDADSGGPKHNEILKQVEDSP
jgi:hypothetical protein